MVVPYGGRASTAAVATFYETLVMMAAGGLVAAAGFAGAPGSNTVELTLLGLGPGRASRLSSRRRVRLGLGLAFLVVVVPPVFGRVAGLVSLPIPGVGPDALPRITGRLLVQGLFWSSGGWILLGLSQLAVVRSFDPAGADAVAALGLAPVVIASVALATVAGFVGGGSSRRTGRARGCADVGAAPALGSDHAVVAALLLRLVWVARRARLPRRFSFPGFDVRRRGRPAPGSRSTESMISVVVPVRDEEESLAELHGELGAVFAGARAGRSNSSSSTTAAATAPGASSCAWRRATLASVQSGSVATSARPRP